ncbi:MAG: LysR family transcriptional regulator [Candidatus Magasanikbacteria bacterium CG10_big_fil_rev_8_21_14_0_10_43_6]|uniref:LysR family transcriptional regulator n=1 Tax=Candidatus Magasanikbacteria bacterium CG10_big_fil_rev_8_21_14_0_10_43_6 TaxID=1974650 RepID=A0A2M6W1B1_9BACT|nr:MAG: LysR family transcriptional regulator [Candidatus Magasanikbacteria bacterium CG10_big_fil_rev_8_21_14_0_10_43_6]
MHSHHGGLNTYGPLVARILLAALFIVSGVGKIFGFAGTAGYIASVGLPAGNLLAVIAIIVEVGGGILLLIGWQGRLAAWILAGYSLLTAAIFHNNIADQTQLISALKNISIAGGMLMVALYGTGPFSVSCKCNGKYCLDCKSCSTCKDGTCAVHANKT